jgi:hypothetical protein
LTVALASAPSGSRRAPSAAPTQLGSWNQQAVPIVIALVDDLRSAETHTTDATQADPASLSLDDSHLQADAAMAQRLEPSPEPGLQSNWTAALSSLSLAQHTLHAAATSLDHATIAIAHQQFAVAGDNLLRVGQQISGGA